MKTFMLAILFAVELIFVTICTGQTDRNSILISAPITNESPGKMGKIANQAVLRIICLNTRMGGTGFFVTNDWIATAAHVIANCPKQEILLIYSNGQKSKVDSVISDANKDLAILKPSSSLKVPLLRLSTKTEIMTGSTITTWGFPSGYNGVSPLLTVGYLSGIDQVLTSSGQLSLRWVVNAAFNSGNSGGPGTRH